MEYIVGPVLALMLSMKYTSLQIKEKEHKLQLLEKKIELVNTKVDDVDKQVIDNTMRIMTPLVNATRKIQEQLGM
jgi:cell division protein FtsL|tara:strand:- start:770 stop:994 length:225 start_codon:yes stop_codon:yes gene_type:complete